MYYTAYVCSQFTYDGIVQIDNLKDFEMPENQEGPLEMGMKLLVRYHTDNEQYEACIRLIGKGCLINQNRGYKGPQIARVYTEK